MARMFLYLMVLVLVLSGCRSAEKSSYSVETVTRTAVNPYDGQLVDKIDLSITLRKSW